MRKNAYAADNEFMKFEYADTEFLVPLYDVVQITSKVPEDAYVLGKSKAGIQNCYIEVQGAEKAVFITAHNIYGVVSVDVARQRNLPDAIRTFENEWIFAAAFDDEKQKVAFLIDCHKLQRGESAS